MKRSLLIVMLLCPMLSGAQLVVIVSPPKIVGQKAVVKLTMKNDLFEKIESARAAIFLSDEQGEMIGTLTKWVIGGTKDRPALEPKAETTFNFVVTNPQPFTTTNLTAKVSFSQLVLESGKSPNIKASVQIKE